MADLVAAFIGQLIGLFPKNRAARVAALSVLALLVVLGAAIVIASA